MKRFTTDTPEGDLQRALNLFYVKDGEAYARGYGEDSADITLNELARELIQWHWPYVDTDVDDLTLAEMMHDWLDEDVSSMEHVLALLYQTGWAFAELRERLKFYEDSRLTPEVCKSVRQALDAGGGTATITTDRNVADTITAYVRLIQGDQGVAIATIAPQEDANAAHNI